MRDPVERFISRYHFHRKNLKLQQNSDALRKGRNSIVFGFDNNIISQPDIPQLLARNIDDCVLQKHPKCLYSGVIARGDYKDDRVAALGKMDLNKIK